MPLLAQRVPDTAGASAALTCECPKKFRLTQLDCWKHDQTHIIICTSHWLAHTEHTFELDKCTKKWTFIMSLLPCERQAKQLRSNHMTHVGTVHMHHPTKTSQKFTQYMHIRIYMHITCWSLLYCMETQMNYMSRANKAHGTSVCANSTCNFFQDWQTQAGSEELVPIVHKLLLVPAR